MPWYYWISLAQIIQCFLILLKRLMIYFNECSLLVCTFLTSSLIVLYISLHVIASHVVFIFGEKIDCISVVLWVHFGAYMYNLMHVNQRQPHRQPFSHATHYISILSLTTAVYYLVNKKWKKLLTVILCSIFFLLERRLMSSEQLFSEHSRPYFNPGLLDRAYMVEDDHIPFLQRGE